VLITREVDFSRAIIHSERERRKMHGTTPVKKDYGKLIALSENHLKELLYARNLPIYCNRWTGKNAPRACVKRSGPTNWRSAYPW
jgi:hypothetical protein